MNYNAYQNNYAGIAGSAANATQFEAEYALAGSGGSFTADRSAFLLLHVHIIFVLILIQS